MYVDSCRSGKYVRHLLRENYREDGKVKHRTIANISSCSPEEIAAVKLALKHKDNLAELASSSSGQVALSQGYSMGAVWTLYQVAKQVGIPQALGSSRRGKLALWQVLARVIDQGSRLSAVRLAQAHGACEILGIQEPFNEDDLYENLDWLCESQDRIEQRLFRRSHGEQKPRLFLYDVTSSYLEGDCNAFAAFGYNRDGKRGKKQIVIGLLCDEQGVPLSIEVFPGNTQDPKTVSSQIRKLAERFGGDEVTFVGDRGMLKTRQIEEVQEHGFHYITAITKPQVESLMKRGLIQLDLFEQELAEVEDGDGIRYILRRNPLRAQECAATRGDKRHTLERFIEKKNKYLAEHPRSHLEVATRDAGELCKKLRISDWVEITTEGRDICLRIDEGAETKAGRLDGCYVIKTDLKAEVCSTQTVHDRYKDLTHVECAFRTSKTVELEMRPIHVCLAPRTRAHALVVMLAYRIAKELSQRWVSANVKVQEGIDLLSMLCVHDVKTGAQTACALVPEPSARTRKLLDLAGIILPANLPRRKIRVATRRKLQKRRTSR